MSIIEDEAALDATIQFLEKLSAEDEAVVCDRMHKNAVKYTRLLVAMGSLVDKSAGSLSKLYELVARLEMAKEYDSEVYEIRHVKHEYGADIVIKERETNLEQAIEIKTSIVKQNKKFVSNWNFALPVNELRQYKLNQTAENLAPLLSSVYSKQRDGKTLLIARHETSNLAQYAVSGAFISLYLVKKLKEKSNLGSEICNQCKEYHRAQRLVKHGEELDKRIKESGKPFEYRFDYFTDLEWLDILRAIPSQCAKTNK